ncbi:hypothetical protein MtrunA17_Chr3g0111801 [Medicago truncatula]|nr:hypothetical protein MtrunA17_Chr3g0111801 [Medicago truncatula]
MELVEVREKKLKICGFHLYGCLAAAQLQQTHHFSENQKTSSSSYNQAFAVRTESLKQHKSVPRPKQNQAKNKTTTLDKTNF